MPTKNPKLMKDALEKHEDPLLSKMAMKREAKSKKTQCSECAQAKKIIQEWMDQQGHDRCWYYPDLFLKLTQLFGVDATEKPNLPPRHEFEEGCRRYQDLEYGTRK